MGASKHGRRQDLILPEPYGEKVESTDLVTQSVSSCVGPMIRHEDLREHEFH